MTTYQQYLEVSNHLKSNWQKTPMFFSGEPIEPPPPYAVASSYGVVNDQCGKSRKDIRGYTVVLFDVHRGKVEKIISDFLDEFSGAITASRLEFENVSHTGQIERIEDDLYAGSVSFKVLSLYSTN